MRQGYDQVCTFITLSGYLTYLRESVDYTGFSDASRASIQMTHSAFGPTVSLEEAQRIERETAEHLLKSRKLSLIVDLDQTIVHATVDPTVGEWINEGEAWEARQAKKASTTPPESGDANASAENEDEDECNPNWEALKDVKRFRLGPESFGPASLRDAHRGKGKNKMVETEGCMYYIKPRYARFHHLPLRSTHEPFYSDRDGRSSYGIVLQSMRCTYTRWEPAHMRKKYALQLIRMAVSSEGEC